MRLRALFFAVFTIASSGQAQHNHAMPHEMQHGFVLAAGDKFASHLVATGHHSRQTEITGELAIDDLQEKKFYEDRKLVNNSDSSYFLFQAQSLDLPSLKVGQILNGHIVESKVGGYDSKNIIVKKATFKVEKILLNMENPFFGD